MVINTSLPELQTVKAASPTVFPDSIATILSDARATGKKVVLATGVFDILHQEHEAFLRKAKAAGDVLIVGLEPDTRVTKSKGPGRPINSEVTRWEHLSALGIADGVFVLPEAFGTPEDRRAFIETLKPAILAVSANTPHLENKQKMMALVGGEVKIVHDHNPAISTTILVEKLGIMKA